MKKNSLVVPKQELAKKALSGIKEEIFGEQIEMVRDYIKGIYRLRTSLETKIESINKEIDKIDEVLDEVKKGNPEKAKSISVPAKYLSEKTVRMNDMEWDND